MNKDLTVIEKTEEIDPAKMDFILPNFKYEPDKFSSEEIYGMMTAIDVE